MTPGDRNELAHLEARLFGLDGSGEDGAIGRIERRISRMETTINRWTGAIALVSFFGFGGVVTILIALSTHHP